MTADGRTYAEWKACPICEGGATMTARWTRDDEYAWQAEQAHAGHIAWVGPTDATECWMCEAEWRQTHPANRGLCLCDTADAPAHEDYR